MGSPASGSPVAAGTHAPGAGFAGFAPRPFAQSAGVARVGFADQLSIETPEQVALEFPIAGIGSRFVAVLLDQLIIAAVYLGLGLLLLVTVAAGWRHSAMSSLAGKWFVAGALFVSFLLLWGYFALWEAFWHGQTPGKRAMKLRVIQDGGRQVTLFESLARNLLRVVDFLPGLYLAGVVTMLANKRNKRLGDLVAGTLVVHERTDPQPLLPGLPPSAFPTPEGVGSALFPADAVARLAPQDLVVMEAFFARALDLPLQVRADMAARIAAQMASRMGTPLPAGNPERMLEALALALRGQARRF